MIHHLMYNLVMQYQILVQNQSHNGYIASVFGMPECVGEAATREEAIAMAKTALSERLARTEVVTVELETLHLKKIDNLPPHADAENDSRINGQGETSASNPWLDSAGAFKDDPTWDDFVAKLESYRRDANAEEPVE